MAHYNRRLTRLTAADLTDQIFQEKVENMVMAGKPTMEYLMSTIPEVGHNAAGRILQRCDSLKITVCKMGTSSREIHPDYCGSIDNVKELHRAFPAGLMLSGEQIAVPLHDVKAAPDDSSAFRAWQDALPEKDSSEPKPGDLSQAPSVPDDPTKETEQKALERHDEIGPAALASQRPDDGDVPAMLMRLAEQLQSQNEAEARKKKLIDALLAKIEESRQKIEQLRAGLEEVVGLIKRLVGD